MAQDSLPDLKGVAADVMATCACEGLRRTARAITQRYDHTLSPSGLRATQLPILVALAVSGPTPVTPLAEALVIDRTTLVRNLKILETRGLVTSGPGRDGRVRLIWLTTEGRRVLEHARELWQQAQASVAEQFGHDRLQTLLNDLTSLGQAVRR
jgi:DNA-binding MarR family transcriptional regulator